MKYIKAQIDSALFVEILKILKGYKKPLSFREVSNSLKQRDLEVERKKLKNLIETMIKEGYLKQENKGFVITNLGMDVLMKCTVFERLDEFVEVIHYNLHMATFDLYKMKGTVPINIAMIDKNKVDDALEIIDRLAHSKLVVSDLMQIFDEDETVGDIVIQSGKVGIVTISTTVYDVIARNINVILEPYAAGLLHYSNFKPNGLVELISYKGLTISPGLLFIRGGYTSVLRTIKTGDGYAICDLKNVSVHMVKLIERELFLAEARGISNAIAVVYPRKLPFDLLIDRRAKLIFPSGLNYFAPLQEAGFNPEMRINETLIEITKLKPVEEFL